MRFLASFQCGFRCSRSQLLRVVRWAVFVYCIRSSEYCQRVSDRRRCSPDSSPSSSLPCSPSSLHFVDNQIRVWFVVAFCTYAARERGAIITLHASVSCIRIRQSDETVGCHRSDWCPPNGRHLVASEDSGFCIGTSTSIPGLLVEVSEQIATCIWPVYGTDRLSLIYTEHHDLNIAFVKV